MRWLWGDNMISLMEKYVKKECKSTPDFYKSGVLLTI